MFTQVAKDNLYSVLKRCRELGLFVLFGSMPNHFIYIYNGTYSILLSLSPGDFVTVRCTSNRTKHPVVCDLHNRRGFNRLVDFINDNLLVMLEIEGDYAD